jgi:hypothetical protein
VGLLINYIFLFVRVILLGFSKMMENEMLEKIVQDSIGPGRVGGIEVGEYCPCVPPA